jgi:2-polyprenyl-6-methoxyphenol hydroxylase-like FAD-dependent oxidoreductase
VLQATLAGALDDGVLQLGAKCTGFAFDGDGVRVQFDDGREERADVLVGADGIRSTIHRQLRGEPQVRYSGYFCWRSSAYLEHPQLTAGRYVQLYATNSNFGIFPIGPDRWAWYGTQVGPSVAGQGADPERWKREALDRFSDWWPPVSAVIEATPVAEMACHDISDRVPIEGWTRGPVVLLGDAAHPTTPTLGQGGCMAIEDALVLARSLEGEEDIASGLRRFEQQRVKHTSRVVRKAWRHGRIYHGVNLPLRAVRDLFILRAPERIAMREVDKLIGYEP